MVVESARCPQDEARPSRRRGRAAASGGARGAPAQQREHDRVPRPSTWQYESPPFHAAPAARRFSAAAPPPPATPPPPRRPALRTRPGGDLAADGDKTLDAPGGETRRGGGVDQVRRDDGGDQVLNERGARAARRRYDGEAGGEEGAERGGKSGARARRKKRAKLGSCFARKERCVGGAAWSHGASSASQESPALSATPSEARRRRRRRPPTGRSARAHGGQAGQPARLPSSWAQMRAPGRGGAHALGKLDKAMSQSRQMSASARVSHRLRARRAPRRRCRPAGKVLVEDLGSWSQRARRRRRCPCASCAKSERTARRESCSPCAGDRLGDGAIEDRKRRPAPRSALRRRAAAGVSVDASPRALACCPNARERSKGALIEVDGLAHLERLRRVREPHALRDEVQNTLVS